MRAIVIHSFGAPEVLKVEELPTPTPRADEVLVEVNAASVNPVDYKTRRSAISLMPEKCGRISRPYSGLPRLVRRSANWKPSTTAARSCCRSCQRACSPGARSAANADLTLARSFCGQPCTAPRGPWRPCNPWIHRDWCCLALVGTPPCLPSALRTGIRSSAACVAFLSDLVDLAGHGMRASRLLKVFMVTGFQFAMGVARKRGAQEGRAG
jgi:hypothetical protein